MDTLDTLDTEPNDTTAATIDDFNCDDYNNTDDFNCDDYYCDDYDDYDDNEKINIEDLVKCGNCGNIWDGYAQCNCYQLEYYRKEEQDTAFEKNCPKNYSEKHDNDTENNDNATENNENDSKDINSEN